MSYEHVEILPLIATIGAKISGVDLSIELDDDTLAEAGRACTEYAAFLILTRTCTG